MARQGMGWFLVLLFWQSHSLSEMIEFVLPLRIPFIWEEGGMLTG